LLEDARVMDQRRTRDPLDDGPILPSRRAALELAASALGHGPIVITGEPGVGKTWLARRIAAARNEPTSWIHVDLSPAASAEDLFGDIALGLGLDPDEPSGRLRRAIAERLRGLHGDGRSIGLRIDEAHLASPSLVEEVRVLTNRFGTLDGFDAFILIGRTGTTTRRDEDVWRSIENRLGGRIHLRPLDTDEWRAWYADLGGESADRSTLDLLRRDLNGNPSRLRRELNGRAVPVAAALSEQPVTPTAPLLGPAKPPLLQSEGLIEVGWDDDELSSELESLPSTLDEPVDVTDHDAIHAWNTWANAQGRGPDREDPVEVHDQMDEDEDPRAHFVPPNFRAEDGQEFAPYGQLFSRSRSTQDRDSAE
jgi:general secretion pathway protein A